MRTLFLSMCLSVAIGCQAAPPAPVKAKCQDDQTTCETLCATDPASCVLAGKRHRQGTATLKQDKAASVPFFRRACEAKNGTGCMFEAMSVEEGVSGPKDLATAHALFEKGCALGEPIACAIAAENFAKGKGGAKKDLEAAARLYGKSCDLQYWDGCVSLAGMYFDGRGVAKDEGRARKVVTAGCAAGHKGCCDMKEWQPKPPPTSQPAAAAKLYYLCDLYNGAVSRCEPSAYTGQAVVKEGDHLKQVEVGQGQIIIRSGAFSGRAPARGPDGVWAECDVNGGYLGTCGAAYTGKAVVKR